MTSRITQFHLDFLAAFKAIQYNGKPLFKYFNIWNDQIDDMITGKSYSFNLPAIFLEFVPGEVKMLGMGYTSYPNAIMRIHFCCLRLNDGDFLDRNLDILTVRDLVKASLGSGGSFSFLSQLMQCEETPDYNHENVYKYSIGYKTNFIDSKGSPYDPDSGLTVGYLNNPQLNINVLREWVSGNFYDTVELVGGQLNNVVIYRGDIWQCINPNSDIIFDEENWMLIESWIPKQYNIGQFVAYYSVIYQCTVENNDTVFNTDNWIIYYS